MGKKVSKQELEKLQKFQQEEGEVLRELGVLEFKMEQIKAGRKKALEDIAKIHEESTEMAKELEEKYGEGTIDLTTGEFTEQK